MPYTSLTPSKYAQQISRSALDAEGDRYYDRWEDDNTIPMHDADEVPEADGPDDADTITVALDGGVAMVDHLPDRIEVTVRHRGRIAAALVLSHAEAEKLGMAIARPDGPTTGDLFALADAMRADAASLAKQWGTATTGDACGCPDDRCAGYHHDAELDHCPCADALAMDGAR